MRSFDLNYLKKKYKKRKCTLFKVIRCKEYMENTENQDPATQDTKDTIDYEKLRIPEKNDKKSYNNSLERFVLISGVSLLSSSLLFIIYFIIMTLSYNLVNFQDQLSVILSWSILFFLLYGIIELLLSIKILLIYKNIKNSSDAEKAYFWSAGLWYSFLAVFIFLILPGVIFLGYKISPYNVVDVFSIASKSIMPIISSVNGSVGITTQYNSFNYYISYISFIFEVLGVMILFLTTFYEILKFDKKYFVVAVLSLIATFILLSFITSYWINSSNTNAFTNINNKINQYDSNVRYMISNYTLFSLDTNTNFSTYEQLSNLNTQQGTLSNMLNNYQLPNYSNFGNEYLDYGILRYSDLISIENSGFQISNSEFGNGTLLVSTYPSVLEDLYVLRYLKMDSVLKNVSLSSLLNEGIFLNNSFVNLFGIAENYIPEENVYTTAIQNHNIGLEPSDIVSNMLENEFYTNPKDISNFINFFNKNSSSNNLAANRFFYLYSLNQYYRYALEEFIYNKTINPNITFIGYSNRTMLINLGNVAPNYNYINLNIDNKAISYKKYFNFIAISNIDLSVGMHNISIELPGYNFVKKEQFYVSPYLRISSSVNSFLKNNSSELEIKINNPTQRTDIISKINVTLYGNNSSIVGTSKIFVGNIIKQNLSVFNVAPKQNITLYYNLTALANIGEDYFYRIELNTNYGTGQYLISGKTLRCCAVFNATGTDATIISTTTSTTSTTSTNSAVTTSSVNIGAYTSSVQTTTIAQTTVSSTIVAVENPTKNNTGFKTYYSFLFTGEPSLSQYNMMPAFVSGTGFNSLGEYGPGVNPDVQSVYSTANYVASSGNELFNGDLEAWPIDYRSGQPQQIAENISKFEEIVKWVHEVQPQLLVGFYGLVPLGLWSPAWGEVNYVTDSAAFSAWKNANEELTGLVENLSYLSPSLYNDIQTPYNWSQYAIATINEGHALGKPVYPFLSMYYYTYPQSGVLVPPYIWALNLYVVGRHANGTILWGGYQDQWSNTAPWWEITQSFIKSNSSTPIPNAPTNLKISDQNTPHLSWNGPTFTNNLGEFVVERSEGNQNNFLPIAVVNTTSYIDNYTSAGTYYYLVKSTNWYQDSSASNIESINTTRNALSEIYSGSYNSCLNCEFWGQYVVWIGNMGSYDSFEELASYGGNMGYLEFNNVNFSSNGVNKIIANLSLSSQFKKAQIYVQLDNLSSGKIVGIFNITPTYDQNSQQLFSFESGAINTTTGVHNLYLKILPNAGTYELNITSVEFGNSGQTPYKKPIFYKSSVNSRHVGFKL